MIFKKIIKNWNWAALSLCFLISALRLIPAEFLDLGGDSAQYIILAESLTQGKGLRMVNYPDEPLSNLPPVFPSLLTPILFFFGRNLWLMHLLVSIFAFLSLVLFYKIFKQLSGKGIAMLAVISLAASRLFWSYSLRILSDIPFLFLSGFTLFFLIKYNDKDSFLNKEGLFTALGLVLTYLCRYIGMCLFLISLIYLWLNNSRQQRFKKILYLALIFLPVFFLWNFHTHQIKNPYVPSFTKLFILIDVYRPYLGTIIEKPLFLAANFMDGINFYVYILGEAIFTFFIHRFRAPSCRDIFSFVAGSIILMGIFTKANKKSMVFAFYFLIYLVLISLWPYYEDGRYIIVILPFIFFYFFLGFKRILDFLCRDRLSFLLLSICCLLISLSTFVPQQKHLIHTYQDLPAPFKNFIALHKWIKTNLSVEGVIFSRKPTLTYFYTSHKTIAYPFSLSPDDFSEKIKELKVKYIIADEVSKETYLYLYPFLNKQMDRLKLLHSEGQTKIFEIRTN